MIIIQGGMLISGKRWNTYETFTDPADTPLTYAEYNQLHDYISPLL
jgi:hypothetical protein